MSSTNDVLSALLAEFKTLNSRISTLEGAVSAKTSAPAADGAGKGKAPKKEKKAKDPSAPKRAPNAWIVFTKRVRDLLKANGYKENAVGIESNMFASALKEENADFSSWSDADILARREGWSRPAVSKWVAVHGVKPKSGSAPASVVSGGDAEEVAEGEAAPAKKARKNPWAGLSEEAKAERIAKMKAGKAAKKAAAEDDGCGASSPEVPAAVLAALDTTLGPSLFAEPKKAAPKKAEAAPTAAAASASAPSNEFKKVMLSGGLYWVNMANGHAYHRLADQSQGEWAGLFVKTPKPHIDDSVPEPGAEAEEEEELTFDE
jgi:hypothetical protein